MDIYKKMRNLIKKILREDDFQWMRDIKPNFFQILEVITKDDPLINVTYNGDEDFYEIRDDLGMKYYDYHDMENFLYHNHYPDINPHNIKETKELLLHYIEITTKDMDRASKDHYDFMHLYQVISDNF